MQKIVQLYWNIINVQSTSEAIVKTLSKIDILKEIAQILFSTNLRNFSKLPPIIYSYLYFKRKTLKTRFVSRILRIGFYYYRFDLVVKHKLM